MNFFSGDGHPDDKIEKPHLYEYSFAGGEFFFAFAEPIFLNRSNFTKIDIYA